MVGIGWWALGDASSSLTEWPLVCVFLALEIDDGLFVGSEFAADSVGRLHAVSAVARAECSPSCIVLSLSQNG